MPAEAELAGCLSQAPRPRPKEPGASLCLRPAWPPPGPLLSPGSSPWDSSEGQEATAGPAVKVPSCPTWLHPDPLPSGVGLGPGTLTPTQRHGSMAPRTVQVGRASLGTRGHRALPQLHPSHCARAGLHVAGLGGERGLESAALVIPVAPRLWGPAPASLPVLFLLPNEAKPSAGPQGPSTLSRTVRPRSGPSGG